MKNKKSKIGFSIHCHHNILVEWCCDYDGRVVFIKDKPDNEVEPRLRLFRMLPKEALEDIPLGLRQAYEAWERAYKAWERTERDTAAEACWRADKAQQYAYKAWSKSDKNAFHRKWCGCKEWNEIKMQLVFRK